MVEKQMEGKKDRKIEMQLREEESCRDNWANEAGRRRRRRRRSIWKMQEKIQWTQSAGRVRNAFNFLNEALAMQTNGVSSGH